MEKFEFEMQLNLKKNVLKVVLCVPISIQELEDERGLRHKRFYLENKNQLITVINKQFKISKNYRYVRVNDTLGLIPKSVDTTIVKKNKKAFLEPVLLKLLDTEIQTELKKYKTLTRVLEQQRADDIAGREPINRVVVVNF